MERPVTKSWIDKKLSRTEREQLLDYLLERTTSPTGAQILDAISELFPERTPPSLRAVNDWKAKAWAFELYLRQLAEDNSLAQIISESSADIADANKKLVDGYVFQQLRALAEGGTVDEHIHDWVLAASRLAKRTTTDRLLQSALDTAKVRTTILQNKIADFERADAERKAAKDKLSKDLKTSGLNPKTLEEIDAKIKLL